MRVADALHETRIADLEARVMQLQERLDQLEARESFDSPMRPAYDEPDLAREAQEAEYWIGAKLIPRLGAVLIILAIAVFAILEASKSTGVDRALLLAAEAALCVAFIAVGEWKRDELEGFGPTLAAIGSCGLYLTTAGGHFAYKALSEAEMAGVFAGLTLLNHAYAAWRNTRLFFLIGAFGGVAAMLFALAQKDYGTALAVYVSVTLAGAAACAIRKWLQLAIVGWLFGLAILLPVIDSGQPRWSVLLAMDVGSLACIAASAWAYGRRRLDELALGPPIALFITGVVGLAFAPLSLGMAHVVALALAGATIAWILPKGDPAKRSLFIGSAAVAFVLFFVGVDPVIATMAYAALAFVALGVGRWGVPRIAAVFAIAGSGLSAISYIRTLLGSNSTSDAFLLLLVCLSMLAAGLAIRLGGWNWLHWAVAGGWAASARWAVLASGTASGGSILTLTLIGYGLFLLVLGFRLRCPTLRMWSFGVMVATVLQIMTLGDSSPAGFKLGALVAVGVMMLAGGYRYVHSRKLPSLSDTIDERSPLGL